MTDLRLVAATWEQVESLVPWDKNPRKNAAAVDAVARSIERFGFGAPIVARESDRVIIAGHTRWLAAKKMRMDKVPVRFLDIDPAESAALALADNRIGEIASWDSDGLVALLRELDAAHVDIQGLGWSVDELASLIDDQAIVPEPAPSQDISDKWEVLVFVQSEEEQAQAIEWIEQGGFKCQPLIS